MTVSFDQAPLVEIIAELRWSQPHVVLPSQTQESMTVPVSLIESNKLEEFFMRFGGECYLLGFQRSERIVPSGFPIISFQPVYRYKQAGAKATSLFQIGAGLFSANAVPPYKSWREFSPIVSQGVEALLKTRDETEQALPFASISLRYIDAFDADFLLGRPIGAFMAEVLGFTVGLPPAVSGLLPAGQSATPFIQMSIPMRNGLLMNISIGEGIIKGSQAVIMDTTVVVTAEVQPNIDTVMGSMNSARSVIHDMFVKITQPIHEKMKPRGIE
ncbi:TIGR04255 family protein [Gammaproteobacteria bacterium]